MNYTINIATDTITFSLPDGGTIDVFRSDPAWEDIIEMLFGGMGSEQELTQCLSDVVKRQKQG